jgi:hypothetical protein
MRDQGGITGVFAQGLGTDGVHQAPTGDVLHASQKGTERVNHNSLFPPVDRGSAARFAVAFCILWDVKGLLLRTSFDIVL